MKALLSKALAAGLAGALLLAADVAQASPDARVDQQIRPDFGGLIAPPLKPRWRPDRWKPGRYRWGRPRPGWPGNGDYPRDQLSATVDCSDEEMGPTPISDALQTLVDNGILYIRSRGVCHETVYVDHPVIIAGEGVPLFDADSGGPRAATIAPDEGAACVRIAPGVKGVELRDLVFSTEKGGRSACIESWDSEVALVRSTVRYWGDAAAVFVSGGKLILRESHIDGRTWDAAVVADNATVDITRSRITGEETGLDLTLAVGESRIDQTGVLYRGAASASGVGVLVRGLRSGTGTLKIHNSVICGWRNGVNVDRGGQADVSRSRLCRNLVGLVSDGELKVTESAIGAKDVGVYVASGRAFISYNRIYDWARNPIWIEPGATAEVEFNWVYFGDDCWKRTPWMPGTYCQRNPALPAAVRDERDFTNPYREWWEADGYDRGYSRDGAPKALPPPVKPPPPPKGRRGRGGGPPPAAPPPATPPGG